MEILFYEKLQEDLRKEYKEIKFSDRYKEDGILRMKFCDWINLNIDLKVYVYEWPIGCAVDDGFKYDYDRVLYCIKQTINGFWLGLILKDR